MPAYSMPSRTPYETLGLPESATPEEIQRAYRTLALRWHPNRHEHDGRLAQRMLDELNSAYEQIMRSGAECRLGEPLKASPAMNATGRRTSASSSGSSTSRSSSDFFQDDDESIAPTTPASSFKDSPTRTGWPSSPFTSTPYRADTKIPTYQSWRTGTDLPEELRQKPYAPSHPSHLAPTMPGIFNGRFPAASAYCPNLPNPNGEPANHPATRRPAISVVVPQPMLNARHHMSSPEKQYVNVFGEVATQPAHSAPYDLPLNSIGLGPSGEWTFSLPLTLEQLFSGIHLEFPIVRRLLSGRSRTVNLDVDIPQGCRPSSRLFCRRVGHEVRPGVLQDIAFIVEEKPHPRLTRMRNDLLLDVRIPWAESMRQNGAETSIAGIDGQPLSLFVDWPRTKVTKGTSIIKEAGMPIRHGGKVVGRGDLIVEWQILPEEHQKIKHFVKRLWKK